MMSQFLGFIDFLKNEFPIWTQKNPSALPTENLFCFHTLTLPKKVLSDAQNFIEAIYSIRNHQEYQKFILKKEISQPHYSVLMSFDFHLTKDGLKLIEINTNASHALTTAYLLDYLSPQRTQFLNAKEDILNSFVLEYELFCNQKPHNLLIVDESPENQKAYFEFLMYQELFLQKKIACDIADTKELQYVNQILTYKNTQYSMVYNRSTDFYFNNTPALQQAYIEQRTCITPHPEEYQLLADKYRLCDFSKEDFISQFSNSIHKEILLKTIPKIELVTQENFDDLWLNRKNLFFKPAQSFGSKAAYKGESVSRNKLITAMETQPILAQEYISAPEIEVSINHKMISSKYDIRFYVYNGKIQIAAARLYQGQTTNFQTIGLGLAPVLFGDK